MRTPVNRSVLLAALVIAAMFALPAGRAQEQAPQRAEGVIREGVTAVLVDVVVRDRRGQPVRDLTIADFEVLEDGVPQTIGSFTPVMDGRVPTTPAPAAAGADAAAAGPVVGSPPLLSGAPGVTALVFHGLSADSRRRALRAAESYVGTKEETANYVGVFGIELSLTPLVPFTRNGVAVRKALHAMATGSPTGFNTPEFAEQSKRAEEAAASAGPPSGAQQGTGGRGGGGAGSGPAYLETMHANMLNSFKLMERDQQGYIATDALFAIVNTMGRLPGRKSVVLFSEGVALPTAVHRLFLSLIDAANRANVSIYTIDAAGLRAESDQARIRDQINQAGSATIEGGFADAGGGSLTRGILEANEDALRGDPATGLLQLAQDTGGQFFNSSNDLRPAFDRVESDLRNYYLLGYTPANAAYDGRFRTIQVKVKRPGVTVAARKGYFAVRNPGASPVNAWEAPALGALEQKPVPNAFPVRATPLFFPERGRPGLVPVIVSLQTAPLTFRPAADGTTYTSDFTVLVRFLDADSQVVRKVSQHYEVNGPLSDIDRAKQGEVIFYRESELPPGVYTMETVVHDALSQKASVRFSTLEVPKQPEGLLRISSVVLVKRAEKVQEQDRRPDNPLVVKDLVLHPNVGEPVSRASKEVGFYFTVYPGAGGSPPESAIALLQNGKLVAQVPVPATPADAAGRVQHLGRLPLDQLAPGTYELRAIARQGGAQVYRSTMLRITE